jgi:hypothetical protein
MRLNGRLRRLERGGGRCPDCPPPALVDAPWYGEEDAGPPPDPPPCPSCGRPADVVRVVSEEHFYERGPT